MVKSMTGSGYATVDAGGRSLSVGIRSVNSRYLNVAVKVPRGLERAEDVIRQTVQERCKRGRISVEVVVEDTLPVSDGNVTFDRKKFEAYASVLDAIERDYGKRIDIAQVVDMKDLLAGGEESVEIDTDLVMKGVDEALEKMDGMRVQEGKAMVEDVLIRLEGMEKDLRQVTTLSQRFLGEVRDGYRERISDLMDGHDVDENRVIQEAAILADKMDITEECVRSASHLDQFRDLISSPDPVGKRLSFLLQEISREVNTIGSKADRIEISRIVVDLKDKVEKVKEQVQNIL